jgi:hypothetical protein
MSLNIEIEGIPVTLLIEKKQCMMILSYFFQMFPCQRKPMTQMLDLLILVPPYICLVIRIGLKIIWGDNWRPCTFGS